MRLNQNEKFGAKYSFNNHTLFKIKDEGFSIDYVNYLSGYKNNL
jgi:hypothetical protein